jgi:hypothetical protein
MPADGGMWYRPVGRWHFKLWIPVPAYTTLGQAPAGMTALPLVQSFLSESGGLGFDCVNKHPSNWRGSLKRQQGCGPHRPLDRLYLIRYIFTKP